MRNNVSREKERSRQAKDKDVDRAGSGSIGVMVSGWCPCVPIGRRESPAQQQSASSSRSFGTDGAPFTVSAATDRAEMVQMFYYENRGKCCKKLLRYNGYPNKVSGCLFYSHFYVLSVVTIARKIRTNISFAISFGSRQRENSVLAK